MIEMRRVRLINWHNFVDDTLDFRQITYLIGVNAVGKTTILDAIRYCLTTSKSFNSLGNRKSGRTLQGSVHGKQRGENIYTRSGHTVSFIGIEFWDSVKQTHFVVTVRVESESPEEDLRHVQQSWYISPENCSLERLPFLNSTTNQPASKEQFCLQNDKMPRIDRQNDARDKICRRLGIGAANAPLGKKFQAVFPMGTSLDEIPDFTTFIYNYILPQPEINLNALQQDERELERLEEVLLEAGHKASQLKAIVEAGVAAVAKQRDTDINEGFVLYADNEAKSGEEEDILLRLKHCNEEIARLQSLYEEAEDTEKRARENYVKVCRNAQLSDEGKALETLRGQVETKKAELNMALKTFKNFQKALEKIEALLPQMEAQGVSLTPELLPRSIEKMPRRRHSELLEKLAKRLQEMNGELEQQYHALWQRMQNIQQERQALENRIRTLESGQLVYPGGDCAKKVRDAINTLLAQQGMEPDAKILCELLYMNDTAWQDCAEACLGARRFDILVPPGHYRTAKQAFEKLGEGVGQVSLLDSRALERNLKKLGEYRENSLAGKVSSENLLAAAYVNNLLGDIICCENSDMLESHPHSATIDLLRHYPYRLARLRKSTLFIGLEARKAQLKIAQEECRVLIAQGSQAKTQRDGMKKVCESSHEVIHGTALRDLTECWGSEGIYNSCWQEYSLLEEEIRKWEESPMLRSMRRNEQLAEEEWKQKQENQQSLYGQISVVEERAKAFQEQQSQAIDAVEHAKASWDEFLENQPLLEAEIAKKYRDAREKRTPKEIVDNQRVYQRRIESSRDDFINNQLIPLQQQYNQRYTCDFSVGLEGVELFEAQYGQLVHIDLERYSASLQKAKERCKERFRQDILFRMKDDIASAKRQFKELNRIMQELRYGEELYQFSIEGSKEPQLNAFYHLIVDKANQPQPDEGTLDALVARGNAAYEAQVDELMERIMQDMKQAAEEKRQGKKTTAVELSSYVDYRYYLDYDIKIENVVTQETTPLSSVSQDSSGGENQAPFYIAICASLLQIYQKCPNSINLVLLDEAFSKMTSDRIRPMMEMFRHMQLQVLMITTVEKASAIYPYCDVTYSIVKSGIRNAMAPFYLEEGKPA